MKYKFLAIFVISAVIFGAYIYTGKECDVECVINILDKVDDVVDHIEAD